MPGRFGLPCVLLLAGACTSPAPAVPPKAVSASACPEHVAEAEAWINRMPGTGAAPRQLVVSARLEDASLNALLLRSDASTPQLLVLDIRTAAAAPVPGRLGYREPAPETPYARILLRCRGADDYLIREIAAVY